MDNTINQLFSQLDKWHNFPNYQLERRVDVFFALYLKDILWHKYQFNALTIIPEFPVHRGSIYPEATDNKSVKIDFVAVDQSKKEVYLIELKTDIRSRREKQDDYLLKAQIINVPGLVDGIIQIYKASKQKTKYNHLMNELINLGWLAMDGKAFKNTSTSSKVTIIYIQPVNQNDEANIISFDDIITLLNTKEDAFSKRFAASLAEWKVNPNRA